MISSKGAASDFKLLNGAKVGENSKANPMKSPKFIDEAIEAEKQLWASINFKGPLDEKVEESYCKARAGYENAVFVDNEASEFYDDQLWLLHYRLIEAYRCRIKACCQSTSGSGLANPQNPRILQENCAGILTGFQCFLAKSTKFYEEMISKLREYYGIPGECSIDSCVFSDGLESKVVQKFQLLCHRCFIYLGDLGRYKELYSSPEIPSFNLSISTRHYLNAASVYPASGNPHNQLALLAMYVGDELQQMYHFVRSLAIADPFHKAWDNIFLLFNKLLLTPLREASLEKNSNGSGASHSESMVCEAAVMDMSNEASFMEAFGYPFTKLISMLCTNSRTDGLSDTYAAMLIGLKTVLFADDAKLDDMLRTCQPVGIEETKNSAFRIIQIVCIVIFAIWCQNLEFKFVRCERDTQKNFIQLAWSAAFDIMGHVMHRCVKYSSINDSPLLPGVLVFVEWFALRTDLDTILDEADEKCGNAARYFFSCFVDMLNKVCDKGDISHQSSGAYKLSDNDILWEDTELWTFSPLLPIHGSSTGLNFIPGKELRSKHEYQVRNSRIVASAVRLVNIFSTSSCNWISYSEMEKRFYALEAGKEKEKTELPRHDNLLVSAVKEDIELASEFTGMSKKTNTSSQSYIEEDEVIIFNPAARNNSNVDLVYSSVASDFIISHTEALNTTSPKPTPGSKLNDWHSINTFSASLDHTEVSRASHSDGVDFWNVEGSKSARLLTADSVLHPLSDLSISSTSAERDQTGYVPPHPKNYVHCSGSLPSRIASPSLRGWIVSKEKGPALPESLASTSSLRAGWSPLKDTHSADTTGRAFPEGSSLFSMSLPSPNTPNYLSPLDFQNSSTSVPDYFSATINPYVSPFPSAPVLTDETIMHGNSPATYPREYVDSSLSFPRHFPISSAPQDLLGNPGTTGFIGSPASSDKLRNWFLAQGLQGTSSGYGGYPHAPALPPIYYFHQYRDIFGTRYGDDLYHPPYCDSTFKEPDILKKSPPDRWMNPLGPTFPNFYDSSYRDHSIPHGYNALDQKGKEVMFYGYQSAAPVRYGLAWDQRPEHLLHSQYPTDSEWYRQQQHV
ncbi:nonsense-mediated mRNA decay factor SMG7-like isoform X1 [Nymphaea colorata]|nr:nonsense-mediated mRNA decay factor SMG7-like isoform X1 [Nymphaea colorata]XP_031489278.1 nonsense-mediated mRNA decay factor SMG7-like isoform X1 [Nymphaea colorata]XP_031489287.1 nonsense-mediated mRNA decay factor SMG7-like isoform X1 [Nymphaea colorata]XP_031489294.1 nonsense-mediated mRNA decay factor SMG7-like isoform X1 [Nymphaea colorata]